MITLGVGDFGVTRDPAQALKTIGLGSCVAVVCADKARKIAGMVHIALPDSTMSPARARELPGYFADTGIEILFHNLAKVGFLQGQAGLEVKLVGGAAIMDPNGAFNIGKRNALAVKRILWGLGHGAIAEDLGGNISRTVTVDAATGTVTVASPGLPVKTI